MKLANAKSSHLSRHTLLLFQRMMVTPRNPHRQLPEYEFSLVTTHLPCYLSHQTLRTSYLTQSAKFKFQISLRLNFWLRNSFTQSSPEMGGGEGRVPHLPALPPPRTRHQDPGWMLPLHTLQEAPCSRPTPWCHRTRALALHHRISGPRTGTYAR